MDYYSKEKKLKIDESIINDDATDFLPFLEKPENAPIYYGHPLIHQTETDGFIYGAITDYLDFDCEDGCTFGDGFVQSPDGTRAGLTWVISKTPFLKMSVKPEDDRWGVYDVGFTIPIKKIDDLIINFKEVLPLLKIEYEKVKQNK